jgi:small subunit ribosomal protein S6
LVAPVHEEDPVREYETTFIVQPEISDEGVAKLCEKLDGVLTKKEAVRLLFDDLGKRRLAYEIQNFQKGRYVMLHFLDEGSVIPDLERSLRLEDSIIRYLTVLVDDSVADIDARKAWAAEEEKIRTQRAEDRAAREAEEAARAEQEAVEAAARAEEAATRAAEAEAAKKSEAAEATDSADSAEAAVAAAEAPADAADDAVASADAAEAAPESEAAADEEKKS